MQLKTPASEASVGSNLELRAMWMGWLLLFLCFWAASVRAESGHKVYVDGIPLGQFLDARYTNVDVEISRDGTIRITTRRDGAADQSTAQGAPVTTTATGAADPRILETPEAREGRGEDLKGRYWVVTQDRGPQPTTWTVDVQLNGQSVGVFSAGTPTVIEVTSFLRNGENTARLDFRRTAAPGTGAALSGEGAFKFLLAPGTVDSVEDRISLGYPILVQERGAADTQGTSGVIRFVLPPPVLP